MTNSLGPRNDWDSIWNSHSVGLSENPGRAYRYDLIKKNLVNLKKSETSEVLDIGCGTGDLLGYLVKEAVVTNCMGIDLSEAGIRIAKKKYPKIAFYQMYIKSEKPYCDYIREKVSHIILSEVLEHIDDPSLTLKWVRDILAPKGYLLVTVPAGPMTYFEHYIGHFTHYSRETLGTLLRDAGFQDITIFRAGFPGINLIRLGSFLRGKRIVKDLDSYNSSRSIMKAGLKLVELVLRYSAADSRFGWQLIAVARKGSVNY